MPLDPNDFRQNTKTTALGRAGYKCSFPNCNLGLIGPHSEPGETVSTSEVAHIRGARKAKNNRYDSEMTPEQRRDIKNAIALCRTHAKLIDSDEKEYTVEKLEKYKKDHEEDISKNQRESIIEKYGVTERYFSTKLEELGITNSALMKFFSVIEHENVPINELDDTLRRIADDYKQLLSDKESSSSAETDELSLQSKAKILIENFEFENAEVLLTQSIELDSAPVSELKENINSRMISIASSLYLLGNSKVIQLKYNEANKYFLAALEKLPAEHKMRSKYLKRCGHISYTINDYKNAINYYDEALELDTKAHKNDDLNTANFKNYIGLALMGKGEYKNALKYFEAALNITLNSTLIYRDKLASIQNNLGGAWKDIGNLKKAYKFLNESLSNYLMFDKYEHPEVATVKCNISQVLIDGGEYKIALILSEEALTIDSKIYKLEHPRIARDKNRIGLALLHLKKCDDALSNFMEALKINVKVFGLNHSYVSTAKNNIGGAYYCKEDYSEALKYIKEALEIDEKILGSEHDVVAERRCNIGGIYKVIGNNSKAIENIIIALKIFEKKLGMNHYKTISTRKKLIELESMK